MVAHRADAPVIAGHQPGAPPVLTEAERALAGTVAPVLPATPVGVDREVGDGDTTAGGGLIVGVPDTRQGASPC